jgi:hypothetical protein
MSTSFPPFLFLMPARKRQRRKVLAQPPARRTCVLGRHDDALDVCGRDRLDEVTAGLDNLLLQLLLELGRLGVVDVCAETDVKRNV